MVVVIGQFGIPGAGWQAAGGLGVTGEKVWTLTGRGKRVSVGREAGWQAGKLAGCRGDGGGGEVSLGYWGRLAGWQGLGVTGKRERGVSVDREAGWQAGRLAGGWWWWIGQLGYWGRLAGWQGLGGDRKKGMDVDRQGKRVSVDREAGWQAGKLAGWQRGWWWWVGQLGYWGRLAGWQGLEE
ncbi:uncharacterized protein [Palaemon carinicauda]|uniref:uncharacterized protein n=1 Tax=Palaemon carinicauda TaxID=392227 RepID=UPI0035B5E496